MKHRPETYTIQKWLFDEAEGNFEIDLAESGIQYHYINDLEIDHNYDLNYSLDRGKLVLRETIAAIYGVEVNNVVITNGAQEALYLFYRSFLCPGDHVITFTPGWQQSWEVPKILGAEVSKIKLLPEDGFRLNFSKINAEIKPNTKLIILNNPNNPVGTKFSKDEINELKVICEKHNIFLLCDEEYFIDYRNSLVSEIKHSGVVSSLSKVYGFPGLRLGWFVGDANLIEEMVNYKRYVSVSNSSLCEFLGVKILSSYEKYLSQYKNIINVGCQIFYDWVGQQPLLGVVRSEGTPFVYLRLPEEINSLQFCRDLLKTHKVLVMPAEVFEDQKGIRISIGRTAEVLAEGLKRVGLQLASYQKE